jgi:N-sulfoglucosamine sulfohydrolase
MMRMPRLLVPCALGIVLTAVVEADDRPNILFCIADDWGWPHAGAYGDPVVKTPTFDRLAREGILFQHAYVSSPSCTPSRGALLTGQWHWRLDSAANLWSVFPDRFATYPEILEKAGYSTGHTGKAWGPGVTQTQGRPLAGKPFKSFQMFLEKRPTDKPFCFWLGSSDPHRPFDEGSGKASGIDLSKIKLFRHFPDDELVRSDVADYYWEVQRFDQLIGAALDSLEKAGMAENTIVLMTGDHGMPFPRCKSNLYDCGTRVPLAVRWPATVKSGRTIEDFVSLTDLAPTFLEIAGIPIPTDMTGKSLTPILSSDKSGRIVTERDYVLVGKERHVPGQEAPDLGGYPCRGIRTHDYFYIRNFEPKRWPNGTPNHDKATFPGHWFADTDNGPTKTFMIENRDKNAEFQRAYELSFGKRPAEELYDLKSDPEQLVNVAEDPKCREEKERLSAQLLKQLQATGDPRVIGGGERFDEFEYNGGGPLHPSYERKKR